MSEVWSYPPQSFKPDPTKPVRLIETEDGKLLLEFFDLEGRMHRIPVVLAMFPYEFQILKDKLPLTDFFPLLSVDPLTYDYTVANEINTGTATSPQTVIPATADRAIEVRGVVISTNSTSGTITVAFSQSGAVIKYYCSTYTRYIVIDNIKIRGNKNEALQISWSGLSSGALIFYIIKYRLIG